MRIIVVDDDPSQRDGRVWWLNGQPNTNADGMTFEQAMAFGSGWSDIDIVVLDGHDRRSPSRREAAAAVAGIDPIAPHDNFVGVRVAELVRHYTDATRTTIIMVSAHARENDLLARRISQAGINYVFEKYEVEEDQETFVRAVMSPDSFSPQREDINWSALGYLTVPDVSRAVATLELSSASDMLLADKSHKSHKNLEWAIRDLRKNLGRWLPQSSVSTSPRKSEGPSKKWLAQQFRQIFGKDLPVDRDR